MKSVKSLVCGLCSTAMLSFAAVVPASAQTVVQVSDALVAFTDTVVPGAAILTRNPDGVEVSLQLTGLDKKSGYTAWWIVFNNPENCIAPCTGDDLGIPEVNGHVFYATGYVTGTDGTAQVHASLRAGPAPEGIDIATQNPEPGLFNPLTAEIHMIAARSHGKLEAGLAAMQIGTLGGNCPCADQQAVVFPAP